MTTAHVITGLGRGGAEASLLKLLEASDDLRREARVVALKVNGPIGLHLERMGVPVDALGIRGVRTLHLMARRATRLAAGPRPRLIQGWMYHGNVAASLWSLVGRPSIPVLWNVRHSLDSLQHDKALTRSILRLGARASASTEGIIYNSRVAAAQHEAVGYDPRRTEVIPNGFDTVRYRPDPEARARFRKRYAIPEDVTIVGHVGRYHPIKGHGLFVEAGARLRRHGSRVHLVMAGRDVTRENEQLATLIRRAGLGDDVTLLGEVANTASLMPSLDVLCSSSFGEGFPNVVGEAMAAGVTCVVTKVGDSGWLVSDTGVAVEPDALALAAGLEQLLALGPEGRRALGQAARARIESQFSVSAMVDAYRLLYERVLAGAWHAPAAARHWSGV